MKMKKLLALILALCMSVSVLAGCGSSSGETADKSPSSPSTSDANSSNSAASAKKALVFGDTSFNASNEEADVNPHNAYSGWACIRYGVGETLFRFNDNMELEPWVAESYENVDELTWKIVIRDNVCFSNGKKCAAAAVKANFDHLIEVHERAAGDLDIASTEADGQVLTVRTNTPRPTLVNYMCDPYGCIIDVEAGITDDGIVVGTGPFVCADLESDNYCHVVKNDNYWNGEVHIDDITVRSIIDSDTLALALQSGEIDMAYGMAYASYPLFENDSYTFTSTPTSRSFYCQMNYASPVVSDPAVRKAVALGINKEGFVNTLLNGYGYTGKGAFPENYSFGGQNVTTENYDPEAAKAVLEKAGWIDTDGDGVREKDGQKLTIKWLTYPTRLELPFLAEAAQHDLGEIGMDIQINNTTDHNSLAKDPANWDIYVAAFVTCGIGDPMYFFTTHCLDDSSKNRGGYHSDGLEDLAVRMNNTFDADARSDLAIKMQQDILDDNAFVFCSFLRMSMICKSNITGLKARPCDYYELTADLDIN